MRYGNLFQIANFLKRTHCLFADRPWQDEWLAILIYTKSQIEREGSPVTGITFPAMTDSCHGEIRTLITISKLDDGSWEVIEKVDRERK